MHDPEIPRVKYLESETNTWTACYRELKKQYDKFAYSTHIDAMD